MKRNQVKILEVKNTIKEIKNELESLGNTADKREERISNIKDRNLEMMKREEERSLSIKKKKELYKKYLAPSKRAPYICKNNRCIGRTTEVEGTGEPYSNQ